MGRFNSRGGRGGSSRGGGRGFGRGRGGGRGGRRRGREPSGIAIELGEVMHNTPSQMVCKANVKDVPMFNQVVLNSKNNGQQIGRIDEILGPINGYFFSVSPDEGINLQSMKKGTKIYIDKAFVLPLDYFLNAEKPRTKSARGSNNDRVKRITKRPFDKSRGRGFNRRGGSRGGYRGDSRGGSRGGYRGDSRGRFNRNQLKKNQQWNYKKNLIIILLNIVYYSIKILQIKIVKMQTNLVI